MTNLSNGMSEIHDEVLDGVVGGCLVGTTFRPAAGLPSLCLSD